MINSSEKRNRRRPPRVTTAVIVLKISSLKLLELAEQRVVIFRKGIRHTLAQKPANAFVAGLPGNRCRIARLLSLHNG